MTRYYISKSFLILTFFTQYLSASFSQPCIQFQKKMFDFDTIAIGSNAKCRFVSKNSGNEPLLLSNVVTSCGCTVAKWSRNPISPGDVGYITVSYDTSSPGSFRKTILVKSNAENKVVLQIKGYVSDKRKRIKQHHK